ncbi:MAG: hypothetical protein Q9174_006548, partial [Haloplaca sp. 1 TL-2023]
VAVLIAVGIYIMAGRLVWRKRAALDGFLNPFNEEPFQSVTMTTEVTITSEARTEARKPSLSDVAVREIADGHEADHYNAYSVNVELGQPRRPSRPAAWNIPSFTRAAALSQENADAFLYARVAFLFFIALLITWVPSSVNRAYALAHPNHIDFVMNFVSAIVFSAQGLLNCMVMGENVEEGLRWVELEKREGHNVCDEKKQ